MLLIATMFPANWCPTLRAIVDDALHRRSAEVGLVLVKEALYAMGVPVAYMQLDDWWYQGPFYFGNVKSVVDWHASNSSGTSRLPLPPPPSYPHYCSSSSEYPVRWPQTCSMHSFIHI